MIEPATPIPLPRELLPGVFWLGECRIRGNPPIHTYNSVYLVAGTECSAFVDGGIPTSNEIVLEQFESLSARGLPELRYVFLTHSEMAHSGVVGELLARYPDVTVHGDVSDMHLVFPDHADRFHFADPGARFDLGETEILVTESVFRDLLYSRWYFDTSRRVLFGGDGFSYSHEHRDGACGHLAEEAPTLDIGGGMELFADAAFRWTAFVDVEPYIERLNDLVFSELDAQLLAPGHGLPIGDPRATMPLISEGMRRFQKSG